LEKAVDGSKDKLKAQNELDAEIAHRKHVDNNIHLIGNILFGEKKSSVMMSDFRSTGQPLVDDWNCFKILVRKITQNIISIATFLNFKLGLAYHIVFQTLTIYDQLF
jgi:hypothetical protein